MLPDSRLDGKAISYGGAGSLRRADGKMASGTPAAMPGFTGAENVDYR